MEVDTFNWDGEVEGGRGIWLKRGRKRDPGEKSMMFQDREKLPGIIRSLLSHREESLTLGVRELSQGPKQEGI